MINFWKEYKGSLIITIISIVLGTCVQIGLMYMKPAIQPTPELKPVITQPVITQPIVTQPATEPVIIMDKHHHRK